MRFFALGAPNTNPPKDSNANRRIGADTTGTTKVNISISGTTEIDVSDTEGTALSLGDIVGRGLATVPRVREEPVSTTSKVAAETVTTEAERVVSIMTREEIAERLREFEEKYGMKSKELYKLWQKGEAPSGIDILRWVIFWEAFLYLSPRKSQ